MCVCVYVTGVCVCVNVYVIVSIFMGVYVSMCLIDYGPNWSLFGTPTQQQQEGGPSRRL